MQKLSKLDDSLYSPLPKEELLFLTGGQAPQTNDTSFTDTVTNYQPGCTDSKMTVFKDSAVDRVTVYYDCEDPFCP